MYVAVERWDDHDIGALRRQRGCPQDCCFVCGFGICWTSIFRLIINKPGVGVTFANAVIDRLPVRVRPAPQDLFVRGMGARRVEVNCVVMGLKGLAHASSSKFRE
jgi:hypothetical protein